jgi:SAM-dependent methyltransferase
MYQSLKHITKRLLPADSITKHKNKLRALNGLFYRGNKYQCNICQTKLRKFILLPTKDLLCPHCGSLPRTRGLWNLIHDKLHNKTILHFSPSPAIRQKINDQNHFKKYITTDYEGEFESDHEFDIENIDLESESVDLIICYHVLEHIENDAQAIRELFRILRPEGNCYVQTPFKTGEIYEDLSIKNPEDRLKHYGQRDHVRIYSPEGLKERMQKEGFNIEINEKNSDLHNYNGMKVSDIIVLASKF